VTPVGRFGTERLQKRIERRTGSRCGISPARPELPQDDPRHWLPERPGHPVEYLGRGYISSVRGNGRWVVKITRERIPEAGIMPVRDDEKRHALTLSNLWAIEAIREACVAPQGLLRRVAEPVRDGLQELLPETWMPAPFILIQSQQHGQTHLPSGSVVAGRNSDRLYFALASYRRTAALALPGVEIDLGVRDGQIHNGLHDGEWRPGDPLARRLGDGGRRLGVGSGRATRGSEGGAEWCGWRTLGSQCPARSGVQKFPAC
jgi:hypothetical protein